MQFEPDQDKAMTERPFRKRYKSERPCSKHGATPIRYTNTQLCVECQKEYGSKRRAKRS